MKNHFVLKNFFLKKYVALILLTATVFFTSQINLLDEYSSYGRARIVMTAEFFEQSTPMYGLGYLDLLKLRISEAVSIEGYSCRSFDLKISTHQFQAIHDLTMYCRSDPFITLSDGRSLDEIFGDELMEWHENERIILRYMTFYQNEGSVNIKILISLLYALILIFSFPWYPVIKNR